MHLRRLTLFALLIPIFVIGCTPTPTSGPMIVGSTETGDLLSPEKAQLVCQKFGKTSELHVTKSKTDNVCV